ncbi:MAG: InlB B-repeat-containing protein [Clostridia bacterium]|nr:InlB B-repeat-containing protein [Clostridia bacterium]
MKKFKLLIIIAVMLVCSLFCGVLTACGGDDDGGSSEVTITYYRYEGAAPMTMYVDKGETFSFGVLPKRTHFEFLGMYDAPNGAGNQIFNKYGESIIVFDRDMTLWMHWAPATYKFRFDAGEGTTTEETRNVIYNTNVGILPTATRTGYDFIGWFCNGVQISNGSLVEQDKYMFTDSVYTITNAQGGGKEVVLEARYEIQKHTVTLVYNDGTYREETIDVVNGETIPEETFAPIDDGSKELIGWSLYDNQYVEYDGSAITSDIRLYAWWKRYKVLEFYDGITEEPTEERVYDTEPLVLEELTGKNGYQFMGWFTNKLLTGYPVESVLYSTGYTKFYARWDMITYTVILHANGGECDASSYDYTIEDEVVFAVPTKKNYSFVGWYVNPEFTGESYEKFEAGTYGIEHLYAKYQGEEKKIYLTTTEGSVVPTSKTVRYGEDYTLPIPTTPEFVFLGWFDGVGANANMIADADGNSVAPCAFEEKEITLFAKYKQKLYVNVNVNLSKAGEVKVNDYYLEGETVTLKATVNPGYTLDGWYFNGNLLEGSDTYEFTMGASYFYIDAKYSANVYTVNLIVGDGVSCDETSVQVTYGENYVLPVASKPGYRFIGWKFNDKVITDGNGVGNNVWDKTSNVMLVAYLVVEDPNSIFVYDSQTFADMAKNPTGDYVLVADIDMSDYQGTWVPFEFKGTFNGSGLSIINFELTTSTGNLGIFSKVTGTIKNITFGVNITSTSYNSVYVGGVCAELTGTLENVIVTGSVKGDFCRIGGLVGYSTGTIKDCINRANVSSNSYEEHISAGGIAGQLAGGTISGAENYGAISMKKYAGGIIGFATAIGYEEVYNYGTITGEYATAGIVGHFSKSGALTIMAKMANYGEVNGKERVGGIYGYFKDVWSQGYNNAVHNLKISNVENYGVVTGEKYVGGIMGYMTTYTDGSGNNGGVILTVTNVKNTGDITGKNYVGGLFGYAYSDNGSSSINNSICEADVEAEAYVGGLAGQLDYIKIVDCSNEGSTVTATGYVLDGTTYYGYVGGYVGNGYYAENLVNDVDITYTQKGQFVGGIAGRLTNPIKACVNNGDIIAKNSSYVGGLVGQLSCAGGYEVAVLTNTGKVQGSNIVGGIIGELYDGFDQGYNNAAHTVRLLTLTNSGEVIGNNHVGGIMGNVSASTWGSGSNGSVIINANVLKNTGNVTGVNYVGGLLGKAYSDDGASSITSSSSKANITAEAYVGGLAGRLENVKLLDSSNEGSTVTATGYVLDGTTYYGYVGGYVGYGYSVSGCNNAVEITYTKNGIYVGGIAGRLLNIIQDCSNTANITAINSSYVGGLVGDLACSGGYELRELSNSGKVQGKNRVGGIIGRVYDGFDQGYDNATRTLNVLSSTNSGEVIGVEYVAGVIGELHAETWGSGSNGSVLVNMNELKNTGNVTGKYYVGGVIGHAYSDNGSSRFECCSSTAVITAEAYIGGLAGRLQNIRMIDCSNEKSSVNATNYLLDGTAHYGYVGGYVGLGYFVSGCNNEINITYTKGGSYVGGIAGGLTLEIQNSSNSGDITAEESSFVGGLVGNVSTTGARTVSNLVNSGEVRGEDYTGGIIGRFYEGWDQAYNSAVNTTLFTNITNSGSVTGHTTVGSIVGEIYTTTWGSGNNGSVLISMNEIHNTGNVTGEFDTGVFMGSVTTDNGSSSISFYTYDCKINGAEPTQESLVLKTNNFTIGEKSN